jgi:hypothetical protein
MTITKSKELRLKIWKDERSTTRPKTKIDVAFAKWDAIGRPSNGVTHDGIRYFFVYEGNGTFACTVRSGMYSPGPMSLSKGSR